MLTQYNDALIAKLQAELSNLRDRVCSGACADYAAYREYVGEIKRLRKVMDTVRETLKAFNEDEDDNA